MSNKTDKRAMIFAQYKEANGFYFTSDDQAFSLKGDALNHAKTLENDSVEFLENTKIKTEDESQKLPATTDEEKEQKKAERKILAIAYHTAFGKNIAPNMSNEKIKELIDAKNAEDLPPAE